MFRISKSNPLQLVVLLSITIGVLKSNLERRSSLTDLVQDLLSNTLGCLAGNAASNTAGRALRIIRRRADYLWLLNTLDTYEFSLED